MRRAILALIATVAGVVGLLHYKTASAPAQFRVTAGAPPAPSPKGGSIGAPPARSPARAPAYPAASPSSPSVAQAQTITGPDVTNRFGDVQVQVTVVGHHITNVKAVKLPSDRARSAAISRYAAPVLGSEALQAQGAQINTVSGATYTSDSYAQSLQAALTQAGM